MQLSRSQLRHDYRQIQQIAAMLTDHMGRYGYESIETPVIDQAALFLTTAGEAVIERLFTFERHGQLLALRPEFTASAAARYLREGRTDVARWQFSGAVFEDDPDDPARHYQHFSVGAELFGMRGAAADAEIISMAALGVSEEFAECRVVIGHVGLLRTLLSQFKLDNRTERFLLTHRAALKAHGKAHILQRIEKFIASNAIVADIDNITLFELSNHKHSVGQRTQQEIIHRLLEKRKRSVEVVKITAALDFLAAWSELSLTPDNFQQTLQPFIKSSSTNAEALLQEWKATIDLLRAHGLTDDQLVIQPELARDWDYYSGIVFEIRAANHIIAAGGRYDGLVQLLDDDAAANQVVPAVGFAYYLDPLIDVLPKHPLHAKRIISIGGEDAAAAAWSKRLRKAGLAIQSVLQDETLRAISLTSIQYKDKIFSSDELPLLIAALENP